MTEKSNKKLSRLYKYSIEFLETLHSIINYSYAIIFVIEIFSMMKNM